MGLNGVLMLQTLIVYSIPKLSSAIALSGYNVRNATEKEFPFVVSIGLTDRYKYVDEKHICTGALISRQHVLTAAHCFEIIQTEVIQVTIGSVDLRKGRAFSSSTWMTFGNWSRLAQSCCGYTMNDIAVIKLTEEVNEPTIQPARLWRGKNEQLYDKNATVVGWGFTNYADNVSRILQTASVTIISKKQCMENVKLINSRQYHPWPNHLITHAEPHILLQPGDSGGPLICGKNEIVGINVGTSVASGCENEYPEDLLNQCQVNAHVNVALFEPFIRYCLKNL